MAISLLPKHLGRYRDLARLLVKYGRSDIVKSSGLDEALQDDAETEDNQAEPAEAEQLAADLEKLGPTYIKLGQLLSTRVDLLPEAHIDALSRLQDSVDPFPFEEVEEIVTRELGVRLSKAFSDFESEPLAAASLGQVHRAVLRDGRRVAVKVQRPDVRSRVREDLEVLEEIASLLDQHTEVGRRVSFSEIIQQFGNSLARELDYLQEAANLKLFANNLREFKLIVVPLPIEDYTTSRVLTMDYIAGRKITELSPMARTELDAAALCEELFNAYLKQVLVDGVFHADPHPGNVFITDDNRIGLIDLGMTGHVTNEMQDKLLRLLIAVAEGDGDTVPDILLSIGETLPGFEKRPYTRAVAELVARNHDRTLSETNVGRTVVELTRASISNGLKQPPELTMLGKTLLNLDGIASYLEPGFNPSEAIRRRAADTLRRRMLRSASPGNLLANTLELNEFVQRLPGRLNKLIDRLSDQRFELKVQAVDQASFIAGIQKVANRITLGLVLAALIVGAAMLMRIETRFEILGYPGLAMLFFIAAALGGVGLIYSILRTDERSRPPRTSSRN